jgi:hypothetical protein
LIAKLFSDLTNGLGGISADGISFSGGPFGEIQGILDSFGLDLNDLIAEFMSRYELFKADLLNMSPDMQLAFNLRPISMPRFPSILQIGSKIPSIQYSMDLNLMLWDKLNVAFPHPTFNGVKIPNVPSGLTFAATFPRGDFPSKYIVQLYHFQGIIHCTDTCIIKLLVELFLPHIAVAFGFAPSFSDLKALSFSLDMLFVPDFGADLSIKLLDSLRTNINLNGVFDRFSGFSISGIPMDPITFEVFRIDNYLPEIQFSLDLSPSINFAALNFKVSDLYDALFPTNIPTIKSFASFIKKDILAKISASLDGLFAANVNVPTTGLSLPDGEFLSLGVDGINIGVYTEFNNELFPPMIDIDAVQVNDSLLQYFLSQ